MEQIERVQKNNGTSILQTSNIREIGFVNLNCGKDGVAISVCMCELSMAVGSIFSIKCGHRDPCQ